MESSVIEKDPVEVKKYMANFVPINNYRSLGDEYLYQVRATLLHSGSGANLFSARYEGMFNEIKISVGDNTARISTQQEVWADLFSAGARRTDILEAHAANANASITEIREVTASTNAAQAKINTKLQASFDDIIVGGRNLIVNSTFTKGYDTWSESVITPTDHYIGKMHRIAPTGDIGSTYGIMPLDKFKRIRMVQGTQYSLSFYGFGSVLLLDQIYLVSAEGDLTKLPNITMSTDLTERRHITFTAPIGGDGIGFIIGATSGSTEDWFSIAQLKLELGTKPTDWTPAPEDVDGYISEVQSSIDEFKQVQISRNEATATAIQALDSRVGDNTSTILSERQTNANRYSTLTQTTDRLTGATGDNEARIEEVNTVITNKYETIATKVTTLEAETELGKGKIENLESVTSNTQEVVATASRNLNAKIEGIGIGGRNLLRNANFKLGHKLWGTAASTSSKNILGNLITITNVGDETTYFGFGPEDRYKTIHLVAGREYVLSFYAEGSIAVLNDIWISSEGNGAFKLPDVPLTTSLGERTELVFISEFTAENCTILIGANSASTNDWFGVVAVKLEQGNKATDWTEAPEDTRQLIDTVEANINEFRQVQVDHNEATTTAINTMESTLGENSAKIVENYNTLVSKDEAITRMYTSLSAEYGLNKTKVSNEIKAVADNVSASVESISTLRTEFEGNKTGVDSSIKSLADVNKAQTERMDNLYADIGVNSAAIASEIQARTTIDEAIVRSVTVLGTRTEDAEGRISKAETAISTNSGAMAQQKTDLTAAYKKAIDDIEIGGRNLARLDDIETRGTDYNKASNTITRLSPYTTKIKSIGGSGGYNIFRLYGYSSTSDNFIKEAKIGDLFTISMHIENLGSNPFTLFFNKLTDISGKQEERRTIESNFKGDIKFTGKLFDSTHIQIQFITLDTTKEVEFTVSNLKIEKGSKATDFTVAPEDTEADINAKISTESTARSTAVEAVAKTVTALDTKFEGNKTSVTNSLTTLTNKDTALTNSINSLTTTVGNNTTAISTEATARSTADTAIGNRITTVEGKTDNALSRVSAVETIAADNKSSLATTKTEVTAAFKAIDNLDNRNLFEIGKAVSGVIRDNGAQDETTGTHLISEFIKVEGGKKYTLSATTKSGSAGLHHARYAFYDSNKTFISGTYGYMAGDFRERTLTAPASARFFRFSADDRTDGSGKERWKFEKGDTATDWSPTPNDVTNYIDTSVNNLKTIVDSKASVSRVDAVENTATQALATAKTELTSSFNSTIDSIEIGGRNLVIRSTETIDLLFDTTRPTGQSVVGYSTSDYIAINDRNEYIISKGISQYALGRWGHEGVYGVVYYDVNKVFIKVYNPTAESKAHIDKLTVPINAAFARISYPSDVNVKLEKGNKATDWSPAPEDVTAAIDAIEIGGRNLVLDSAKEITASSGTAWVKGMSMERNNYYAFSVDLKGTGSIRFVVSTYPRPVSSVDMYGAVGRDAGGTTDIPLTENYQRYWVVILCDNWSIERDTKNVNLILDTGSSVSIKNIKFEKGNKATDWSPAPEDITKYVDTSVSNLKTIVDSKASISRVDTVENNANQAVASAKTALTGSYTTAISVAKGESATDATGKANEAERLAKAYADTKVTALSKVVDSKATISRVDTVENDANQALATAKTELTSSYKQAIDDIEVGGRNLLKNSQAVRINSADGNYTNLVNDGIEYTVTYDAYAYSFVYLSSEASMVTGQQYTYSIDVATDREIRLYLRPTGSKSYDGVYKTPNTSGKWVRVYCTFTYTGSGKGGNSQFGLIGFQSSGGRTEVKYKNLKIEQGNKGTNWSAPPEDIDNAIQATDARITAEKKVAADATSAVASTVSSLSSTVNGHTSSINETKTSLNGISAKWAMETNVNGKVSGIYQHSTGKKSGLDIITDRFTLSNGTNAGYAPFRQEGNTTYLNMAVIKNASLDLAKINKASITNLSALSANIGHFKSATTGARLEIKDSLLSVYDANNKLRVRLGIW